MNKRNEIEKSTATGILNTQKHRKLYLSLVSIVILISALIALIAFLHLPPIQQKILSKILSEVNSRITCEIQVKNFRWIPSSWISFSRVTVADKDGTFAKIDRINISYRFQFKWPEIIKINKVALIDPKLYLKKKTNGKWNFPVLKKGDKQERRVRNEDKSTNKSYRWEFLVPRKWIIEEGIVKVDFPPGDNSRGNHYDFKSINAVLKLAIARVNSKYQGRFSLKRASFYLTSPGLGLVVANGDMNIASNKLTINSFSINAGKSYLGISGRIFFRPDLKPDLAVQVQNLVPSKVALFIQSWPFKRNLNLSAHLTGTADSISVKGSGSSDKSSFKYMADILLAQDGKSKVSLNLSASRVNLRDISLPVDSGITGEVKLNWLGKSLRDGMGTVRCNFEKSVVENTKIISCKLLGKINNGVFDLTSLKLVSDTGSIEAKGRVNLPVSQFGNLPRQKNFLELQGNVSDFDLKTLTMRKTCPRTKLALTLDLQISANSGTHSLAKRETIPVWKVYNGNCKLKVAKSTVGNLVISRGSINITLSDGILCLREAKLYTTEGYLDLTGKIELPGKIDIRYDTDINDLSVVSELTNFGKLEGRIKSAGHLKGELKNLDWTGYLSAMNLRVLDYGARMLKVKGVSSLTLDRGERNLEIESSGLTIKNRLINKIALQMAQSGRSIEASGLVTFNRGKTSLVAGLESPDIFASEKTFIIKSLRLKDNFSEWDLQENASIKLSKTKILIEKLRLNHQKEEISLEGVLNRNNASRLEFTLNNINLEKFGTMVGKPIPVEGLLDSALTLTGTLNSPIISATGNLHDLKYEKSVLNPLKFDVSYNDSKLSWKCIVRGPKGSPQEIFGDLSIEINLKDKKIALPQGELSGSIKAKDFHLSILKPLSPQFEVISGLLDLDVKFFGTKEKPRISGTASLSNCNLKMKGWRKTLKNINLLCRLHSRGLDIVRGKALWGEGKIRFSGWVPFPVDSSTILNLSAKLDNLTLPGFYGIHSRIDANLHLGGDRYHPHFTGEVKIKKAVVLIDELMKDSDTDIEVIDDEEKTTSKENGLGKFGRSFFENLAMNLDILVEPGHAWVSGKGLNAEIAGELTVSKANRKPVIVQGELNTVRGAYNLQGKIFKIVEGRILFNGLSPPDPNLHVVCEYKVKDVLVYATLKGSASKMRLDLSSDPPMEKVDILAYVLYGHPADELTSKEASNLGDEAIAMVGNRVARLLKEKILPDSPWVPDIITYKSIQGEEEQGGVVMIGKYITPDLYVDVEKATSSNVSDQMRIEYKINKYFSIESEIGDEANSGVDIFWRYDFGE